MATRNACCKVVPLKVSSRAWDRLDRDFLKEELFGTLTLMKNGKALGMDGLPCEFSKAMWNIIGDDFCCLASQVITSGRLSEFLNQGLIKIISKNETGDYWGLETNHSA